MSLRSNVPSGVKFQNSKIEFTNFILSVNVLYFYHYIKFDILGCQKLIKLTNFEINWYSTDWWLLLLLLFCESRINKKFNTINVFVLCGMMSILNQFKS